MEKVKKVLIAVGFIAVFSNIVMADENLTTSGFLRLEVKNSGGSRIRGIRVWQNGSKLNISGRLKRRSAKHGNVIVEILDPSGKEIARKTAKYQVGGLNRKGAKSVKFYAYPPVVADEGSTVILRYEKR